MKKLWIGLLSVALLMAFTMPAAAVDVKFSGSYYVEGVYRHNASGIDQEDTGNWANAGTANATPYQTGGARSLYFQRLRVQTEFKVVEGLKLVTRFDAMEKRWGDKTWTQASAFYPYDNDNRLSSGNAGSRVQENIEFSRVYMDFNTAIGRFLVGYQEFGAFGTVFFDTSFTKPGLKYFIPVGPVTLMLAYDKQQEWEVTGGNTFGIGRYSDLDKDEYYIAAVYKKGNIEAGMLIEYLRNAMMRSYDEGNVNLTTAATLANASYQTKLWLFDPYFKGKFGPVFLESELIYGYGKWADLDNSYTNLTNVDVSAWGFYLHARADISMFYGGFAFAWVSGDDPGTPDKVEGGLASLSVFQMGQNWSPTLIFKNDDHATYTGGITGALARTSQWTTGSTLATGGTSPLAAAGGANTTNQFMDNIWFYQLYFGVKPTPKLDIVAKVSYAYADKKPWAVPATLGVMNSTGNSQTEYGSSNYGTEVDLIATYKIYDNLQYMVGFGYFWTGDYYKGYVPVGATDPKLANDYLLMHRLTLTF